MTEAALISKITLTTAMVWKLARPFRIPTKLCVSNLFIINWHFSVKCFDFRDSRQRHESFFRLDRMLYFCNSQRNIFYRHSTNPMDRIELNNRKKGTEYLITFLSLSSLIDKVLFKLSFSLFTQLIDYSPTVLIKCD